MKMAIPYQFNPLGISKNKMPTDGLVFYAPLDTNTIAKKGTLTKSPYSTSEVAASTQNGLKCISFDGAVSYYDSTFDALEAASKGTTQSNLYTISFWVKTNVLQTADCGTVCLGTVSHGNQKILEVLHPGGLVVHSYYNNINTGRNICDGVWRHIVITSNGSTKKVLINNQEAGRRTFTTDNLQKGIEIGANSVSRSGGMGASSFFTGFIKCVRVYNRQLSQEQITQLFNQFLPVDNWYIYANDQTFNFYQKNEGFTISASGGVKILSYQIISGTLPNSIIFNTSSGRFYGKGLTDDDHVYNLQIRIHGDRNISKDINVTLNTYKTARISITSKTFNFYTDGSQNDGFNYTSDQSVVTFTAVTQLPTGLTLSGNTFYSDGTTPAGTYSIQVKGVSANNQTGVTAWMAIVMNANVITIATTSLEFFVDKGITSKNLRYTTSKHSITPIYSYSGTLPAGITFDSSTGTFASDATQTADTSGTVQVTVASSTGYSTAATANVDLIVKLQSPPIPDDYLISLPLNAKEGTAETGQIITYSDDVTSDDFAIVAGVPSFGTGSTKYLTVTQANIPQGTGAKSIVGWFYCQSFATVHQRGIAIGSFNAGHQVCSPNCDGSNYKICGGGHSRDYATPVVMQLNTWYHIAQIFESDGTLKVYVNGNLQLTRSNTSININNTIFAVGHPTTTTTSNYYFIGRVAAARLYNRALTSEQVQRLAAEFTPSN